MTEKTIQPKSSSGFPNLIFTPDLTLATVNDLTYLYASNHINTSADYTLKAVGTITMAGIAVEDETFVCGIPYVWKNVRTGSGEVTIGASAAEACTNLITALLADTNGVVPSAGSGTTVIVTASEYGTIGNSIDFSELSTNMVMNGSGHLGGTIAGTGGWEELEHIDIVGQDFPAILTASDIYSAISGFDWNTDWGVSYKIKLYDNTASALIWSTMYNVWNVQAAASYIITNLATEPFVRTIETLINGHSYTWSMSWMKHRTGATTCSAISQSRMLTIQEIKR